MISKKVKIDSMEKLQSFVSIINGFKGHFDLCSGCSRVNARSLMGIFSLDISQPLYFYIHNDEYEDDTYVNHILNSISAYVVGSQKA